MHEFGIMQGVLNSALERAAQADAKQIHLIRLRVGRLAGVIPEAMHFAHDVVCEGTMAEGCKLEIENVPARCHCARCGKDFEPEKIVFKCPECGEISSTIVAGRELELVNMEIS